MIEATIYTVLSNNAPLTALIGTRLFPVQPTLDTQQPYVVYHRTETNPLRAIDGTFNLTQYEVTLEVQGFNLDNCLAVQDACRVALDNYRSGSVQAILYQGQVQEEVDEGYRGTQQFMAFAP